MSALSPANFARALIGATAAERLLLYLGQIDSLAVKDAEIEIPRIRAEAYAAGVAAAREAVAGCALETARLCSCHEGEMRSVHEPEEARTAALAAIDAIPTTPEEPR